LGFKGLRINYTKVPKINLFSCALFNGAARLHRPVAPNDRMNNELEIIWKEAVVAY
jgi:hypothetical protein